jgi:UDP-N-acetylmuramoyl-L-alanyl-D-glutamate--2,6-diaminopimelate ligase
MPLAKPLKLLFPHAALASLPHCSVSGLSLDSRKVKPGQIFVALPGQHHDGSDFLIQALDRGARVIFLPGDDQLRYQSFSHNHETCFKVWVPNLKSELSSLAGHFYGNPSEQLKIIAITGTNGKTSSCHIIAQLLTQLGKCCAVMGTLGNGLWSDLKPTELTTPDAITTQALLAKFVALGADYVVMEASSHGLDQNRLSGLSFAAAVFTNLSQDHLDYHHSLEVYGASKLRLFSQHRVNQVIVNQDDAFSKQISKHCQPNSSMWGYSRFNRKRGAAYMYWQPDPNDLYAYQCFADQVCYQAQTPFFAPFQKDNLTAALSCLVSLGFDLKDLVNLLPMLQAIPGRLQSMTLPHGPRCVVDFAHTPEALKQVCEILAAQASGQLITVFGCGGDREKSKRSLMGGIAERLSDVVIITDDNPRSESPRAIADDILSGCASPEKIRYIGNRDHAVKAAFQQSQVGDIILVAGKGDEQAQYYNDGTIHKSDWQRITELAKNPNMDTHKSL